MATGAFAGDGSSTDGGTKDEDEDEDEDEDGDGDGDDDGAPGASGDAGGNSPTGPAPPCASRSLACSSLIRLSTLARAGAFAGDNSKKRR